MANLDQAREAFIIAAGHRWDSALKELRETVQRTQPENRVQVRTLILKMLQARTQTWWMFTGNQSSHLMGGLCMYTEAATADFIHRVEFLRYFIGHELHDDGEPCLIWARQQKWPKEGWEVAETAKVPKSALISSTAWGHRTAAGVWYPIFHRSCEARRRGLDGYPPDSAAPWLHDDTVLLVLAWYERHAERTRRAHEIWLAEDNETYEDSKEDRFFASITLEDLGLAPGENDECRTDGPVE